jgi:predicted dehydrogenase
MKPTRIAIIGLGYMGQHYLKVLLKPDSSIFDNVSITAICDTDEKHLEDIAERYNIPLATKNADEAIQSDSVDAVIIATPTKYHHDQAKLAIDAQKPIYCEKPLALDEEETGKLTDLVNESGLPNQVGLVLRHSPVTHYLKKTIENGELGKPLSCRVAANSSIPKQGRWYRSDAKRSKEESGGGILKEENIHDIDTLIYLFGDIQVKNVQLDKFDESLEVETDVEAQLYSENGTNISYESHWHDKAMPGRRKIEIVFEHGKITADYFFHGEVTVTVGDTTKSLKKNDLEEIYKQDLNISEKTNAYKSNYGFYPIFAFLRSLTDEIECTPSFSDAHKAEEKIQEMYKMATWKQERV